MPDPYRLQTKNDPLCGFFRWGAKHFPITNSHICIVRGEIDGERLRQALRRILPRFELLRDALAGQPADTAPANPDVLVRAIRTQHPVAFDNDAFRAELMNFVASTESPGLARPPLRLLLVHAVDGSRTAVHLGIGHDVADVKSGNIVLAALMNAYETVLPDAAEPSEIGVTHEHHPLSRLRPAWYRGAAALLRRGRAQLEITRRMTSRERTLVRFGPRRQATARETADANDFHHQVLTNERQARIHAAAETYGVTINTLFCAALTRYIGRHQEARSPRAVYTIAVSLRRLLGAAHQQSFRSFMVDCTLNVPHEGATRELLAAVDAEMAAIRNGRLEVELGRMESAISLFRNPLPKSLVYWVMKRTQGTNLLYSNPGIVEEDLRCFGNPEQPILQTAIFGCLVHPYDLMFLTPTINGRLQLDVVYRRAHFPDVKAQFVEPFLAEIDRLTEPGN